MRCFLCYLVASLMVATMLGNRVLADCSRELETVFAYRRAVHGAKSAADAAALTKAYNAAERNLVNCLSPSPAPSEVPNESKN